MWLWEVESELTRPENEHEFALIEDLRSLRRWFAVEAPAWVIGYGQTWFPWAAGSYPLILLRSDITHSETEVRSAGQVLSLNNPPRTKLPLFEIGTNVPTPSSSLFRKGFSKLFSPSPAIYPAGSNHYGTAGVTVRLADGTQGIATAGHVFRNGVGQEAESVSGVWPFRRRTRLGTVALHMMPSPTTGPGWDIAVVRPERKVASVRRGVIRHPSARIGLEPAYARGATSGLVDDIEITAGLEEIRGIAGMTWYACWFIGPTAALRGGDSGTPLFSQQDDKLLGIYVGHATNKRGEVTALFVQDAYSIQHNVLNDWQATF